MPSSQQLRLVLARRPSLALRMRLPSTYLAINHDRTRAMEMLGLALGCGGVSICTRTLVPAAAAAAASTGPWVEEGPWGIQL